MAIGKLFELHGKVIVPKDDCYVIAPIKAVIDKYPEDYLKLIAYLHYMSSMKPADNPYADVPIQDRSDIVISDLELDVDVEDPVIKRAIICIEDMYYTTFYGLYTGIKTAMDKIGKGLKTVEIDFSSKDGNIAGIIRLTKDYESLRNSFKAAYKDFDEEQGNVRVRGNSRLAIDESDEDDDIN